MTDRRSDRKRSGDALAEQADRLHELAVLSLFLHSAGTLEEMLSLFLERAPRVTGAVITYPLLLDRRREVLTATHLQSVDDPALEQASLAANENLVDLEYGLPLRSWLRNVMESGEVTITDDLKDVLGSALSKESCDHLRAHLEIHKVAVVPLVMEGESFGVTVFMYSGNEPDVDALELTAGHITLALKALMFGEETTRFGGIDPVTWAHGRGFFLEALDSEVQRARRFGRGLSLVFLDIDEFGEFNANYGHTLGDRVLRSVAMTLAGAIALPEIVSRYGADEFAVLLPESNRAMAVELTAGIVRKMEELNVFEDDSEGEPDHGVGGHRFLPGGWRQPRGAAGSGGDVVWSRRKKSIASRSSRSASSQPCRSSASKVVATPPSRSVSMSLSFCYKSPGGLPGWC